MSISCHLGTSKRRLFHMPSASSTFGSCIEPNRIEASFVGVIWIKKVKSKPLPPCNPYNFVLSGVFFQNSYWNHDLTPFSCRNPVTFVTAGWLPTQSGRRWVCRARSFRWVFGKYKSWLRGFDFVSFSLHAHLLRECAVCFQFVNTWQTFRSGEDLADRRTRPLHFSDLAAIEFILGYHGLPLLFSGSLPLGWFLSEGLVTNCRPLRRSSQILFTTALGRRLWTFVNAPRSILYCMVNTVHIGKVNIRTGSNPPWTLNML